VKSCDPDPFPAAVTSTLPSEVEMIVEPALKVILGLTEQLQELDRAIEATAATEYAETCSEPRMDLVSGSDCGGKPGGRRLSREDRVVRIVARRPEPVDKAWTDKPPTPCPPPPGTLAPRRLDNRVAVAHTVPSTATKTNFFSRWGDDSLRCRASRVPLRNPPARLAWG